MFQLLLAVIYLSFISLGLPDALLGASWPTMYQQFDVPISYAGIISMTIAGGTIISSLQSDRVTKKFGPGKVTAFSVLMTAVALFGFSISTSFWMLFLWAIPYGLGAGSVDASLNNYVALHYESRHMSWLHCMWGVGASTGPYILSFALANGHGWNMGYRYISIIQIVLTAIIMFSLPLWKNRTTENNMISDGNTIEDQGEKSDSYKVLSLKEIISIPGAKPIMLTMLTYCALEQTAGLWASSYLVLKHGLDAELAAGFGSLFYIGITVGRAISGFVTMRLNDNQMIRLGQVLALVGIVLMFLPLGHQIALIGLIIIGLGGAPIYPCVIHSTPENFGADKSQAIIGVQMASAYVGTLVMPAIFGFIANHISVELFPFYLSVILLVMFMMHVKLLKIVKSNI
jgi:fucose permease